MSRGVRSADTTPPTPFRDLECESTIDIPAPLLAQRWRACCALHEHWLAEHGEERRCHYQVLLRRYLAAMVPAGARVLEFGCGCGDLLAHLQPGFGVGVDLCPGMIQAACRRHPHLTFHAVPGELFESDETFDVILMSDLLNEVYDVQEFLRHARTFAHDRTRLVVNSLNNLWRPLLAWAAALGLRRPPAAQNWLSLEDLRGLLALAGWEVVRAEARILCPVRVPGLEPLLNRWAAPFLRHLCLTQFLVARPIPSRSDRPHLTCSVIVPARNEAGNLEATVRRIPRLGAHTEIILVEGGSEDGTWGEMERLAATRSTDTRTLRVLRQSGQGKKAAVAEGIAAATGDVIILLDADLSVPPEELEKFYSAIHSGTVEFANGVRLVYPMEPGAMRFLNLVANRCFRGALSFVLGQPVRDTLCGTKACLRSDYLAMARIPDPLGHADPFGDFDLLFGAAKLSLRIVDVPVHYRARVYGSSNILRWRHGGLLLRMLGKIAIRIRFPR